MNNLQLIELIAATSILLIDVFFFKKMAFARDNFRLKKIKNEHLTMDQLPTVSVCMPVRNESKVISDSLDRILANDYPKMEVIVLDDDSVDDSSEIIKAYANQGVRFIKGGRLKPGWIGKNKALKELSDQANGDYILFLSVDTKITPETISKLVKQAVFHEYKMISVMPRMKKLNWSVVFGTMRFFWETILHSDNLPAISTSAWLVKRQSLVDYKDFFERHRLTVRPEDSLARYFYEDNDYRFFIANDELDVTYDKEWSSQVSTSIRTLVPLFEKTIWLNVTVLVVLLLVLFGWLLFSSLLIMQIGLDWSSWLLLGSLILFNLVYLDYNSLARTKAVILSLIITPVVLLQELILLIISHFKYKFSTVSWKGRKLPDIED